MPLGKACSQATHAGRISLLKYIQANPHRLAEFIERNSCGSVVALRAKNLEAMKRAALEAEAAGLPWALFSDSGHILPPDFTGEPIITALAIGPAGRAAIHPITRKFRCL